MRIGYSLPALLWSINILILLVLSQCRSTQYCSVALRIASSSSSRNRNRPTRVVALATHRVSRRMRLSSEDSAQPRISVFCRRSQLEVVFESYWSLQRDKCASKLKILMTREYSSITKGCSGPNRCQQICTDSLATRINPEGGKQEQYCSTSYCDVGHQQDMVPIRLVHRRFIARCDQRAFQAGQTTVRNKAHFVSLRAKSCLLREYNRRRAKRKRNEVRVKVTSRCDCREELAHPPSDLSSTCLHDEAGRNHDVRHSSSGHNRRVARRSVGTSLNRATGATVR